MGHSTRDNVCAAQRCFAASLGIAYLAVTAGCAGRGPHPASAHEVMARVGRPCPALPSGDAPSLVFIELADTRLAKRSDDLAAAIEAPLPIRGSGGLLASLGETVSVPWGGCRAEPCEPQLGTLTMTPRLRGTETQLLELTVQLTPADGSSEPPRTKQLEARNQEPVLLRFDDGVPSKPVAWILTPYLMSNSEGLKRMHACRMTEAHSPSL
jgi:hypothetical protein